MGKTRKKTAPQFEVLLSGEFYGAHDRWTEYLCLARNADGSITLTSRAREILTESGRYKKSDFLPATIRRKAVWGFDGDYVVGERLLLHDGDAEITVAWNQFDLAVEWLTRREWHLQPDFGEAWAQIRSALYGPEFFGAAKPLPLLSSAALDSHSVRSSDTGEVGAPAQPNGRKPREIMIRCPGPLKPWIIWLELVFLESSQTSFSVHVRTGDAVNGFTESLVPSVSGRLSWRSVLEFVGSHDQADVSGSDPHQIDIHGVEPWQRDVIAAAMLRLSTIVPLLSRLSDRELRFLHDRLGGFLSDESYGVLWQLATITQNGLLWSKSLTKIAQLVGSPDPMDAETLADDCAAYLADRKAERLLAEHRDTLPPEELFLSLLQHRCPRSLRVRAGLFELWLRAEPKPKGGDVSGMRMHDELPVLHWLLRGQVAEVFQANTEKHSHELQQFVSWFLDQAGSYTEYFSGTYRFGSFNVYAFGRPRFAAWASLAQEVQDAATSLGISFPESVRLPAMPALDEPTNACLLMSPVRPSRRRLKWIEDHLFVSDSEEPDSNP